MVLAYHRVGDPSATPWDPALFSTDAAQLDAHLSYIRKHRRLVGLDEAVEIVAGKASAAGNPTLLTFDDGYLDNYQTAFPLLASHGAEGVFFLVSDFAAGGVIPWWDEAAWIVKSSARQCFSLGDPGALMAFAIAGRDPAVVLKEVLDHYKSRPTHPPDEFIQQLALACEVPRPVSSERMFVSWDQAREMQRNGMRVGAHSVSHPILSSLCPAAQRSELERSREILERELQTRVDAMAYPVGSPDAFTAETEDALRECGYRAAFSCYGGANRRADARLFDIRRVPVWWDAEPEALFAA
jgi:peptidoglycan/xylan/chitin deacetylase (PgdA/CDA1 family)